MVNEVMCSCCKPSDGPALSVAAQRHMNEIRGLYRRPGDKTCGECGEVGHYRNTCPAALLAGRSAG